MKTMRWLRRGAAAAACIAILTAMYAGSAIAAAYTQGQLRIIESLNVGVKPAYNKFTVNARTGAVTATGPWTFTPAATSDAIYINGTALTTGDGIQIKAVDGTLNGGKYINLLGGTGSTAVWTVGEDGVTAITSTGATTDSLTITNTAATTGDLLTLVADDSLTTNGYFLRCRGGASSASETFNINQNGALAWHNGESISNSSDNIINLTTLTMRQQSTANDYCDVTMADAGTCTFDITSDATASFSFSDPVTCASTLSVTGAAGFLYPTELVADASELVVAGTDNNKHFLVDSTGDAATTITLPSTIAASYAGMRIWITQLEAQNLKITGASDDADFIYCLNKAGDADYVTFDQAGEQIGATVMCMCVAANKWLIVNMTGDDTTLTVTDTDP